jgi:hypothetical protein
LIFSISAHCRAVIMRSEILRVRDAFMLRRVFPYVVAAATGAFLFVTPESLLIEWISGIVSGVYIFKPLILNNVTTTETCVDYSDYYHHVDV